MNKPLILYFKDITEKDLYLVGGKGANLGVMSRGGFNVPPGFCITTNVFDMFMETIPALKKLFPLLSEAGGDIEAVKSPGLKIRSVMENSPIPPEVEEPVLEAAAGLSEVGAALLELRRCSGEALDARGRLERCSTWWSCGSSLEKMSQRQRRLPNLGL